MNKYERYKSLKAVSSPWGLVPWDELPSAISRHTPTRMRADALLWDQETLARVAALPHRWTSGFPSSMDHGVGYPLTWQAHPLMVRRRVL